MPISQTDEVFNRLRQEKAFPKLVQIAGFHKIRVSLKEKHGL